MGDFGKAGLWLLLVGGLVVAVLVGASKMAQGFARYDPAEDARGAG